MIFGYLESRGTGEPPHLTLGRGATQYTKEVVGLWPRGWGKKKMRPSTAEEERSGRGGQG